MVNEYLLQMLAVDCSSHCSCTMCLSLSAFSL